MEQLVNVQIRSHLIPFFYEEMEGTLASYNGQKVKMVRLLPSSSLANYIYTQINYEKKDQVKQDSFLFYLSIKTRAFNVLHGTVYIDKKGVKSELLMPLDKVRDLNNILEDIFRMSLVSFVDGFFFAGSKKSQGIRVFMEKYNMIEYGFEFSAIKKMYHDQKRNKLIKRFQTRSTNQVTGYM